MKNCILFLIAFSVSLASFAQKNKIKTAQLKKAKQQSDAIIISVVGQKIFDENIKWDKEKSFVKCYTKAGLEEFSFTEKIKLNPNSYRMYYYIVSGADTLRSFNLKSDSIVNFSLNKYNHRFNILLAHKLYFEGTYTTTKEEAIKTGRLSGVKGEPIEAILTSDVRGDFQYKTANHFWAVTIKDCKMCRLVHVHPTTGKVLGIYLSQWIPAKE